MFNDRYGLTESVLQGRKTMTRRNIPTSKYAYINSKEIEKGNNNCYYVNDSVADYREASSYKIGEVVAVAQPYRNVYAKYINDWAAHGYQLFREDCAEAFRSRYEKESGWGNKMFVKADIMPHHIRITNVRIERLQDISNEDCMREGIFLWDDPFHEDKVKYFGFFGALKHYEPPRDAFAALIDKIGGKGTWERNDYVWVYEFFLYQKQ